MIDAHQDVILQIKQSTDYFTKAKLIEFLVHQKHVKIKDLAAALGMKQSYLCHIMRLTKISEIIMDGYYAKLISISHLFVLSLLPSTDDMMKLYEEVLRDNLTVLQTEERARAIRYGISAEGEYIPEAEIRNLKSEIKTKYSAEAKLIQTRVKTKLLLTWQGSQKDRKHLVEQVIMALAKKQA